MNMQYTMFCRSIKKKTSFSVLFLLWFSPVYGVLLRSSQVSREFKQKRTAMQGSKKAHTSSRGRHYRALPERYIMDFHKVPEVPYGDGLYYKYSLEGSSRNPSS